jgi:two-component system chemotaxis response regulator CheY
VTDAGDAEPERRVEPNGMSVLVVDDVATTRAILRKILTDVGFSVLEADSGEEAIKLYHAARPTAVTLDVHMNKLSGMGAMQVILKLHPEARIIVCSSEYSPQYVLESMRLGAKTYVAKPFTSETVLAAVQKALG